VSGTPTKAGLFAAFITFAFFVIVMNIQARGWAYWYRLATGGKQAPATIISHNPVTHNTCGFEFSIDSHIYRGSERGCGLMVGQSAQAVYLPSEPSSATLRSPKSVLLLRMGATVVLAVLAGLLSAWRTPREAPRL
jgi:hypothetical protein